MSKSICRLFAFLLATCALVICSCETKRVSADIANIANPDTIVDTDTCVSDSLITQVEDRTLAEPVGRVVGSKQVSANQSTTIAAKNVMLLIDSGAVSCDVEISVLATTEEHSGNIPEHLANLTADGAVYRMLPDGQQFERDITIAMRYDSAALPYGYTADDIYTFFFNEQTQMWQQVERDSVDPQNQIVYSRTNHFTDYINGVLKVPENSDAMAYTPTSIKDLKAADPMEGITLIAPPEANNMGTANLTYPLTIPAGRHGMQPQLAVNYNSAGGSGILGLGWSLPISEISVDTRRGVPLFSDSLETETYTLDGEVLVTAYTDDNDLLRFNKPAYASPWKPRSADTEQSFYLRVEGAFRRIIRQGTGPKNYSWVVTGKDGTKYYYGESDTTRLKDADGNIARWCLSRVEDTYGNEIIYTYVTKTYHHAGNANAGRQILLYNINYTAYRATEENGRYNIRFVYSSVEKVDATTSARFGFLEADITLLDRIDVLYDRTVIRQYVFGYKEGAYGRTLLCNIVETDEETFAEQCSDCEGDTNGGHYNYQKPNFNFCGDKEYFDSIEKSRSNTGRNWDKEKDTCTYYHPVPHAYPDSCMNGNGDSYTDHAIHGRVIQSSIFEQNVYDRCSEMDSTCKHRSYTEHRFQYSDVPTIKFSGTKYISNSDDQHDDIAGSLFIVGGNPGVLDGSGTKSWNIGGGVDVGYGWNTFLKSATLGGNYNYSSSRSEGLVTLIDLNGDGLFDKIFKKNGKLYYRLRDNANPERFLSSQIITGVSDFLSSSSEGNAWGVEGSVGVGGTSIGFGVNWSDGISTTTTYFSDIDGDGLPDLVQNGKVYYNRIHNDPTHIFQTAAPGAKYVMVSSCGRADTVHIGQPVDDWVFADYVDSSTRVCDTILVPCKKCGYAPCGYKDHQDTYEYKIDCHPYVYTQPRPYEPNLENVRFWEAPWNGFVHISDKVEMLPSPYTGDGVRLIVQLGGDRILRDKVILPGTTTYTIDTVVWVSKAQRIYFRTLSRDNRTADRLVWDLTIDSCDEHGRHTRRENWLGLDENHYSYREDFLLSGLQKTMVPFESEVCIQTTVRDSVGRNPAGEVRCEILVNGNIIRTIPVTTSTTQDGFCGHFNKKDEIQVRIVADNRPISWSDIKAECHIYIRQNLAADEDSSYACVDNYSQPQPVYFFDYYPQIQKLVYRDDCDPNRVYMYEDYPVSSHSKFGTMYRNWGQFAYKAPECRSSDLLFESLLACDDLSDIMYTGENAYENVGSDVSVSLDNQSQETAATVGGLPAYNPLASSFFVMQPDFKHMCWSAYSDYAYIENKKVSLLPHPADGMTEVQADIANHSSSEAIYSPNAVAVSKKSFNESFGVSGNVSVNLGFSWSGGSSFTKSQSRQLADMLDLNGDGIPDVVSEIRVQYSQPFGGLSSITGYILTDNLYCEHSYDTITGGSFGGSAMFMRPLPSNGPRGTKKSISGNVGANIGGSRGHGSSTTTWVDINGDGLPDKVYRYGNDLYYYQNTGHGLLPRARFDGGAARQSTSLGYSGGGSLGAVLNGMKYKNKLNVSITAGMGVSYSENTTDLMITDLNGDGLPDRIHKNASGYYIEFNNGNGFGRANATIFIATGSDNTSYTTDLTGAVTAGVTFGFIPLKIEANPKGGLSRSLSRTETQWSDMNGDGIPDYVWDNGDGRIAVRYSRLGEANRLVGVSLPSGGSYQMSYILNDDGPESNMRHYVMSSLTVKDNRMQAPDQHRRFRYASRHYDRMEREDYGYAEVVTIEDSAALDGYRRTVQQYHNQDYLFRGLCHSTAVIDGSSQDTLSATRHEYRLFEIASGDLIAGSGPGCYGDGFPAMLSDSTLYYDGGQRQIVSRLRFGYTALGNMDTVYDDGALNDPSDDYIAATTYALMPDYISVVTEEHVFRGSSTFRYRKATHNSKGDIEELTFQNNASSDAVHRFKYDEYGNIEHWEQPENHQGQHFYIHYTYDSETHSLPTKTYNAYGLTSYTEYDYRWQKPVWTESVNGARSEYRYDNQGRLSELYAPFEYATGHPTIRYEYYDRHPQTDAFWRNCRLWARTLNDNNGTTYIGTVTISDGLGRPRIVKKDAAVNGQPMRIVSGYAELDALGRKVREYHPDVESLTTPDSTVNFQFSTFNSQLFYDRLDRVARTLYPDSSTTSSTYSVGNDADGILRLLVEATDQNGHVSYGYSNVREQNTTTIDPLGATTVFHYDPIGQLLESTDPEGHSTYHTYDMLGRRIDRDHPSAGLTHWKYDPAGNIVRQIQNDGGWIEYSYEYNRPTYIKYSDRPWNNVWYKYGDGNSGNEAGRLVRQQDATGVQEFKYDGMGNVVFNRHTYVQPHIPIPLTLVTEWQYDSWGRVINITYPDREKVDYRYDFGGQLYSIDGHKNGHVGHTSYICEILYNHFGQRTQVIDGDDVKTTYAYDSATRRLAHLTDISSATGEILQDNHYYYDKVGNVDSIRDSGRNHRLQTYKYDEANRLVGSDGNMTQEYSTAQPYGYKSSYKYSPAGRILNKYVDSKRLSTAMGLYPVLYNNDYFYTHPDNPYAITHIQDEFGSHYDFRWDKNGNLTGSYALANHTERRLCWTEDNRLQAFMERGENGGIAAYYNYSADGERNFKYTSPRLNIQQNASLFSNPPLVYPTLYASSLITLTKHGYTKHYFEEGRRICSKIGGGLHGNVSAEEINKHVPVLEYNYEELYIHQREGIQHTFHTCIGADPQIIEGINLHRMLVVREVQRDEEEPAFFYRSDHLGSAAYLTLHGQVYQTLNYLPYGEDWVEYNIFHPTDTTRLGIYRFNGKEKDYESGFHYYGARYYWSEVLTGWLSVDPMADELASITSYSYCNGNPIVMKDPDGEFPLLSNIVGAAASVLVEYGGQVVTNLVSGQSLSKALTDVDYTDLGIAAVEGFVTSGTNIIKNATVKTTVKIGSSIVKNTVDAKKDGVTINDAKSVATNTVLDLAGLDKSKGLKIPSPKVTTANKAVTAAKTKATASGKSISGVQAKQIAQKTRTANTNKRIVHKTVQNEYQTTPGKTGAATGKGLVNRVTNQDKK